MIHRWYIDSEENAINLSNLSQIRKMPASKRKDGTALYEIVGFNERVPNGDGKIIIEKLRMSRETSTSFINFILTVPSPTFELFELALFKNGHSKGIFK